MDNLRPSYTLDTLQLEHFIAPIANAALNQSPTGYTLSDCQLSTAIDGVRTQTSDYWLLQQLYGHDLWCARWLNALSRADRRFLSHLGEQTECYIHYLCLVRLAWKELGTQLSVAEQSRLLQRRSQKSMLNSLYQPYPDDLLKTISKLGHIPLSKNYYRLLVELQRNEKTRTYLAHATRVRSYHLRWLNEFPFDLLDISVLRSIKKASQYRMLLSIVTVLRVVERDQNQLAILDAVKRLKTLSQIEHWFQRFVQTLTFPSPPWPGNDYIKPISSAKALKSIANKFNNCIYEYVRSVLLGYKYFYVCERGQRLSHSSATPS